MTNKISLKVRVLGAVLAVFYLIVTFLFTPWLESAGDYASYIFEVIFVAIMWFLYRSRIKFSYDAKRDLLRDFAPSIVVGAAAFLLAKPLGLIVPFDLRNGEAILFLLLIGPILEELIFRMALWEQLQDLTKQPYVVLTITTLLFAYAHFQAIWFVPQEIHPFVIYQTSYVVPLALYCGLRRIQTGSMTSPIVIHLAFNLGFFLASFAPF